MTLPSGFTLVCDATHQNISHLPAGVLAAGYTTGSAGIAWTAADWTAHPHAVRIDQDPAASDKTADVLDVETGAATAADVVPWFRAALANYEKVARPGQRHPVIYASQSSLTPVANALVAGGVTANGPGLWIASWSLAESGAVTDIAKAGGPYPVVGVQFMDNGLYDTSVFSAAWLSTVSAAPAPPPPPKPVMLGIVTYIQENFRANEHDIASKHVTSADGGETWR